MCFSREVEDTFMCVRGFFPASRQHQSRAASMWVRVYVQRTSHSTKMTERLEQRYCINFFQKLGDSQVETVRKIQWILATIGWASHKLRNGATDSKMTARQWRATLVLVGRQQAENTSLLTKCGLWSCRTVVSPSENLRRRGDKHWFGTFYFDR
jgi:hypothetical protein